MENEYVTNQNQLTSGGDSPKLNGGDIFMVGGEEGAIPKSTDVILPEEGKAPAEAADGGRGGEGTPPPEAPPPADGGGERSGGGHGRRDDRSSVEDYQRLYDSDPKHEAFWKELKKFNPHTGYDSGELIKFMAELYDPDDPDHGDKPMLYLVNRIVAQPLDTEATAYQLGLTAQSNWGGIESELKVAEQSAKTPEIRAVIKNRREKAQIIAEAVRLMHDMNRAIGVTTIEEFGRMADSVTPEQQQILQKVKGASQVMRLFEDEYQRILMDDKTVTTEKHDEILGKHREVKNAGERARETGSIEEKLKALIAYAKSRTDIPPDSSLGQLKDLEDWEIGWAFNAGRLLNNISLRAAEHISLSEVPEGDAAWRSLPQEQMVRLFNRNSWIVTRFAKGEARGGIAYINKTKEHYQELREKHGFGKTRILKLAGKDIKNYEFAGQFKVCGIYTGWRNTAIFLDHAPMVDPVSGEKTTIGKYLKQARMLQKENRGEDVGTIAKSEADILRALYLDQNGELKAQFTNSLGILIRHADKRSGDLQGKEKDFSIPGLTEAKTQIRTAIWKKIAEDNPLAVAYFLKGMEFSEVPHFHRGGVKEFNEFTAKLNSNEAIWGGIPGSTENPGLRQKLIIAREVRMAKIASGEDVSLQSILDGMTGDQALTSAEKDFLRDLQGYGKDVAGDLAAVRLPFNPFMTDAVFEQADYISLGNQYYQRRVGDIGATYKSYEALERVIGDTAGISREDGMKALKEAIMALDGPNGWESGQDSVLPYFMALLDFWESGGQYREGEKSSFKSWLAKDNLYGPLAHYLRMPNSMAQQFGGTDAISYDEFGMWGVLNEAYQTGITRKELKNKDGSILMSDSDDFLRKKKNIKKWGFFWAIIRNLLKPLVAAMVVQGAREASKEHKS